METLLRITVSTFLLIFWSIHTDGQEALIATLKAQIDTCQTPLLKSDLSLGITRLYMLMGLSDEATIYCENALRLARQEGDLEEEANAMAFKMMIERERGHPFISVSQQALELARASKSKDAVAFVSYIIAEQGIHDYKNNIRTLTEILEAGGKEISLKNRGNILKALGGLYEWTGQFQEAETYYLRAEEIFKTIRDHIIIDPKLGVESAQLIDRGMYNYDQCLIYRALLYNKMGRFADAISIGNKALENSRTVDESEVAYTSAILGDIYIATGDMDKAIPLYQAAMDFYQIRDDGVRMGQTYLRFANLFQLSKDYEQAIIYLRKSIDLFNQSSQNLADTYQKLANVLLTTGQKESGMNSLIKADSLYALMNDSINQIRCQLGLAGIQAEQGKSELATMRIQDYLPMITAVKDYHLLFTAYFQLATINRINSDPSISIQYAHKALEIATERGNDKIIFEKAYELLSDLEAQRGNFEQAYLYQKQFHLYYDSIYTENAQEKLKEEQVRQNIDTYVQEKDFAEASAMNLNRKNRQYFLIILIILSFLGITTFLIIQLRKIRRKLELQNLQLNDLNQTKDRFFGIIAHDIRSPIIALESVEEQVKYYANKKDLAKVFKISSMISQTARQLNGLLDNLLNWSFLQTRSIQYRPEKINLNEITQEVIELFRQNAIAKEIQVKTTIDPSLSVKADKNALHTVIRNLLSNAIKFTPEGGLITLKAKQINHEIHLQTIDKGVGLSPDQIEKLFDLGNRSGKGTAGEKGTGLGLILCRELLEQNHGALLIESKKDEGSVFTAVLPAA